MYVINYLYPRSPFSGGCYPEVSHPAGIRRPCWEPDQGWCCTLIYSEGGGKNTFRVHSWVILVGGSNSHALNAKCTKPQIEILTDADPKSRSTHFTLFFCFERFERSEHSEFSMEFENRSWGLETMFDCDVIKEIEWKQMQTCQWRSRDNRYFMICHLQVRVHSSQKSPRKQTRRLTEHNRSPIGVFGVIAEAPFVPQHFGETQIEIVFHGKPGQTEDATEETLGKHDGID